MPDGLTRLLAASLVSFCLAGCSGPSATRTTDPPVKLRVEKLAEVYLQHVEQKGKGPADEKAFKEYISALPKEQREQLEISDDLDAFLTSPRDNQKYAIRYGLAISRAGEPRAFIWEQAGKNGKRFVALSMGYVEEYDEEGFKELRK